MNVASPSARRWPLALLFHCLLFPTITGSHLTAQYNAEIGSEITWIEARRAPLVREAQLARNGESVTLIAYPERSPDTRRLAESIRSALFERFSIDARVRSSAEIVEEDYRTHTVIHLGNIYTNPALLWFYLHSFTYADASWPGGDGWAVQQAHDPKGYGNNVLIVAASSEAGLEAGVARLAEEIGRLTEPVWRDFIHVESETPPVTGHPEPRTPAQIAVLEDQYLQAMRNNALRHTAEQAIWEAKFYLMSGDENYLSSFRACVPAHLRFLREGGNQQAETLYFWFFKYAQIWDAVEHSNYWDDDFRETMVNLLYWLSEVIVSIGHFERSLNPYPKNNHETYAAISLLFSSLYFQKYYDLERANDWRHLADRVLQTQTTFTRGMDEARFYYEHASMHALFYAIATGDRSFIESGRARNFADLLLMVTDNTGSNPNFGDGRRYGHNRTYYYLLPFANLMGAPAYLRLENLVREYVSDPQKIWAEGPHGHSHSLQHYIPPVDPALPPPPPGVSVFLLEEALYERKWEDPVFPHIPPPSVRVPYSSTFDKLVFRNGYDPNDEYLLLDGYGRGIHSHRDANVITRFTDKDRVWLVDDTYFRNSAAYHNGLMVVRDGEGGFAPPFAALETAASLHRTGFSRTTTPGFNGVDWTRNIFWIKEDLFAVIDETVARDAGGYVFQTFWRSLGEMTASPDRVQLDQAGKSFALSFPSGSKIRTSSDLHNTQDEGTWATYPHAYPVVRRTTAYAGREMNAGDRHALSVVFYTFPTHEPRTVQSRSVNDTVLLAREGEETKLFFSDPSDLPGFISTDARMGIVTPSLISLAGVRFFALHGSPILDEPAPINGEIDLADGTIRFMPAEDGLITDLEMSDEEHRKRQAKRDLSDAPRLAASLRRALDQSWLSTSTRARDGDEPELPELTPIVKRHFDDIIHAAIIAEPDEPSQASFVIATDAGVQGWSSDDTKGPVWTYNTTAPVRAITLAKLGGEPAVIAGTTRGTILALNLDGTERWTYQIPRRPDSLYGRGARVFSISAADTDGSGSDEILVTTSHWMSYFLNSEGKLIWGDPVARNDLISSAFGDIDGDGKKELLIGSENFRMHAFTRDYRILWTFRSKRGTIDRIHPVDLNGDGADEILIGSSDGHLYAVKTRADELVPNDYHERNSDLTPFDVLFEYDTGGDVLAITSGDVDDDGTQTIVAGSDSFFIYRFSANGAREAMVNTHDMVRYVRIFDDAPADQRIAAGLASGRVLLLDPNLVPTAQAEAGSEILSLKHDPKRGLLLAIGRSSFAVFPTRQ